jgi:uncharacterized phage-associated protein
MYDALDIAKYIVNKCTDDKCPITNLQLQKIMYFLQRKYLVEVGRCLFADDIQAWQFGPVVPEVYYQFCGFGSCAITMQYVVDIEQDDVRMINPVVDNSRGKDPWDLVSETHAPGRAWAITYRNGTGNRQVISPELIRTKG